MKFAANTRRRAIEYEKALVDQWKQNHTFEKSIEQRPIDNAYVFYDGPPFITGVPHTGTLLSSIIKDAVPRYWTMKGKRVERVWGWDCHGLPAENFVEKKLGITDRHEIGTRVSLEQYITTARESMIQTGDLWESTIDRIGRWVDFKGAYKTMDKDYMESVWWAFKQLHDKGKIYEGEKVLMYDTKWATPLSKAEVTMDAGAYQVVTDPSVYVKFKLKNEPHALGDEKGDESKPLYMLAWTTTPWTLPANTALAVNPELEYEEHEIDGERLIIAQEAVVRLNAKFKLGYEDSSNMKLVRCFRGEDIVGLEYEPLLGVDRGENAHKVWAADYVSAEEGTGIVHLAPAYGEEDFELAKKEKIPVVHVLDEYGIYTEGDWKGEDVWEANKPIAKELKERGVVWKIDYIQHEYPHNPRTGQRLMYRAHPSWFFDIDGQRSEMLEENEHVNWFPEHIKHGRFEKTVQQAPDWNLSRDRFWATAMPVWKSDDGDIKVVGSYDELEQLSGIRLDDYHRPWVDGIEFDLEGKHYKRIDKVLDCWFESGSMPFAQFHYPFENKDKFEANFPGDFVVEYVGQVRAWFYYMHAVNVGLFGHEAFKNVIVTGNVAGNDGFKMSKSRGNFTDPNELMDKYSADALRFLLLQSPLLNAEDFSLQDRDVADVARKLGMIWNMYDFFTLYASVDGWDSSGTDGESKNGTLTDPSTGLTNPLDTWIISRVHQLLGHVTQHMDAYDIPHALEAVLPFIDDASNWYVRRSRRRFWKSEDDTDKNNAYRTLHYVLVRLSQILAPFVPFLAEELYQKLTGGESVHLVDWPEAGAINEALVDDMALVRQYITEGLALRAFEKLKVRQPLASVTVPSLGSAFDFTEILQDELNVKQALQGDVLTIDLKITPELKREGQAREIIRLVQAARKNAGLSVDDRIKLSLVGEGELQQVLSEYAQTIAAEVLATDMTTGQYAYVAGESIEGLSLAISLEKA